MKYLLDDAVAKKRRSQTIIELLSERPLSVWYNVKEYCQRLAFLTKMFTADVADCFTHFFNI